MVWASSTSSAPRPPEVNSGSLLVVFFESGRLGNQLLQYSVIRNRFSGRLLFFGGSSLRKAVPCRRTWFVSRRLPWRALVKAAAWTVDLLTAVGIVGEAREVREGEECRLEVRPGRWKGVLCVRQSFFQHAAFEKDFEAAMEIDGGALREATDFVSARCAGRKPLFLHVRRGDYLRYPSPESPAALPHEWIEQAVARLRELYPDSVLFICTDDPDWVRQYFVEGEQVVYCNRGELGDLAVMASCEGGVLSPSSYSWCAAFLARKAMAKQGRLGHFLAPRYWIGHRAHQWYPAGFRFPWITYV